MIDKEKLLSRPERKTETISIQGFDFVVNLGMTGLQLYHIEKQVAEVIKNFQMVQDGDTYVTIPEDVRYVIGLLSHLIEEPKLTLEEWALVFNRRPNLFLALAKRVADLYFNDNDFSSFFSQELLDDVLNKD